MNNDSLGSVVPASPASDTLDLGIRITRMKKYGHVPRFLSPEDQRTSSRRSLFSDTSQPLSSAFQTGSSQRRSRKSRLRKAERLARPGAPVGTLLWGLGASGCPPSPPIPGRAASLPLPSQLRGWDLGPPGSRPGGQNSPQPAGRFEGCHGHSHFRERGLGEVGSAGAGAGPGAPP